MDRMSFIPGPKAKAEIHEAEGRIFFNRAAALDYADEFIWPGGGGGGGDLAPGSSSSSSSPHAPLLYQLVCACLSEGDLVDVWFGLRGPDAATGEHARPDGEDLGHTWAVLTRAADGQTQTLWEVGRDTPSPGEAYARRAFDGFRQALAEYQGTTTAAEAALVAEKVVEEDKVWPTMFREKPVASRALAPANLYRASARMWYFVDFAPPDRLLEEAPALSRPVRAFDALILSTLVTLAYGAPPLVFGVRYRLENIGRVPAAYLRTRYEADEGLRELTEEEILLVM
ncbi:hypothetical protein ISF_03352 [Cordyceps fumosorosea ARSEF 2679]|uniref:Uncharacterized protein n=1 Tax=Cordyceps fumosorosea (strain ARSEF 2679) TaxID=1081104 RepID=A0A168ANG8_CORFA|nr:hypothetical protein ISF_03352 [Cordyceps fumosorosea ARSEF 2679]OAA68977.1 hypothetical protein ISF_03352 [Cordyceps fumosorosea ARSEF 2679]